MSLRFKILSGFLILSLMLFAAGALSIYELNHIGQSVQSLLDENYKSINAAKNMIEALERQDSGMLLLLSGEWERGRETLDEADRDFQQAFQVAKNNITIPGETNHVSAIDAAYAAYRAFWNRPIAETPKQGNLNWYFTRAHPAFLDAKTRVNQLMSLNDRTLYKTASALKNRAGRAIMPGVVAIVSALVFTAVFNFFINLYFISPIVKLTAAIRLFLKTGARSELRLKSRDEIANLAAAVEALSFNCRRTDQTS